MTGGKGRGKTTLLDALLDGASLPGVRSEAERGADGLPVRIWLTERGTDRRCVVGRREGGPMLPAEPFLLLICFSEMSPLLSLGEEKELS